MKKLIGFVLLFVLCAGCAWAQDQCANCKCTEYPVPDGCEKCCGVIRGKVTAASASHVAVASDKETQDLQITQNTVIPRKIQQGDSVTVVYNKGTKEAGLVKVD